MVNKISMDEAYRETARPDMVAVVDKINELVDAVNVERCPNHESKMDILSRFMSIFIKGD